MKLNKKKIKKIEVPKSKLNALKLNLNEKFKLIFNVYKRTINKIKKGKVVTNLDHFKFIIKKFKKIDSSFLNKISKKKVLDEFYKKTKNRKRTLKKFYKLNNRFLTKRLRKTLVNFEPSVGLNQTKKELARKVQLMNRFVKRKKMRRNLRKRSFFFKIIRKKRRRRLNVFRINKTKPIFTKKTKKEKKFLLRARETLLHTKKFLYRKQFPKIKGKKNKNFNFFYYNNIDRAPFKFNIGRVVITYLLNNTFINIHNNEKMLKVISAGRLGFKGPKRSTPYSRQVVARKAINYIARSKMNVLDIFLNSNYNRWYYFLFKEISKPKVKPYVIRYLVISNSRAHGFIRDRKHRRK